MPDEQPILELRGVSKSFGSTAALSDVSFKLRPGSIHCLLGDNGAGKSPLIKVLSGYHPPSAGLILFDGQEIRFTSPRDARRHGIATVHQDVGSIPGGHLELAPYSVAWVEWETSPGSAGT